MAPVTSHTYSWVLYWDGRLPTYFPLINFCWIFGVFHWTFLRHLLEFHLHDFLPKTSENATFSDYDTFYRVSSNYSSNNNDVPPRRSSVIYFDIEIWASDAKMLNTPHTPFHDDNATFSFLFIILSLFVDGVVSKTVI